MPLKEGSSRDIIGSNIKEIVHSWENSGNIGTSHPTDKKKAVKQAVAIALEKSRESKGSR